MFKEQIKELFFNNRLRKVSRKGFSVVLLIAIMVLLIGLSFLVVYPILTTLSLSFRPAEELFDESVVWIPKVPTLVNYVTAFVDLDYLKVLLRTILVAGLCSVLHLATCSMAAYSLSRFKYKFKNLLFMLVVFTIIVPPQTAQIPNFISFRHFNFLGIGKLIGLFTGHELTINLLNTHWVLILPALFAAGLQSGLYVFIFRQFFLSMPKGLEEAARIDGCNAMGTFLRIIIPNSLPVYVVVFLLNMVEYWNDTAISGMYIFSDEAFLIMHKMSDVVNYTLMAKYTNDAEVKFGAMAVLAIIPPIILYMICQTQFTAFLDRSGLKG